MVANCPKALAPVNGIPFITFLLDQLVEARVSKVVVCAGHMGVQLRRALAGEFNGLPVVVSQENWPMGTGGALRHALDHFTSDMVLVMNGDSYVDTSLARFCQWGWTQPWESAVLLTWTEDCARYGSVDLSILKNIPIRERLKVQLRAEMFNLFNRVNLASGPGSVPTGGCGGTVANGGKCLPVTDPNFSGFGLVNDTIGDFNGAPGIGPGEAFNMQLAIKIIF